MIFPKDESAETPQKNLEIQELIITNITHTTHNKQGDLGIKVDSQISYFLFQSLLSGDAVINDILH